MKINSKWIKDLNVKLETIKFLGENVGRTLFGINHSNISLDLSPKAKEIKAKINTCNLIKLKSFCTAKETIDKMKTIKKMVIGIHISIIKLNVNGLNAPTKRHRLAE